MPSPHEIWHWQEAGTAWKGAYYLINYSDISGVNYYNRASGYSVRLVKDL